MIAINIYYILVALGICILILACGIALGSLLRGREEGAALPLINQVTRQCASQLAGTISLTHEAKELSEACAAHEPRLPEKILHNADSVARASALLQKQLESLNDLMTIFQKSRGNSRSDSEAASEESFLKRRPGAELGLLEDEGTRSAGPRTTSAVRLRFDLWQYVAAFDGSNYPSPEAFQLVHCTGSSGEGFSFFSEQPLRSERLIVAVGSPSDLQFFVSEALQTRPTTMNGEPGHVTACLFVEKLAGVYKWDSKQCRIARTPEIVSA